MPPERDWFPPNKALHEALVVKVYNVRYILGDGRHDGKHGDAILPDPMRWLWSDQVPGATK